MRALLVAALLLAGCVSGAPPDAPPSEAPPPGAAAPDAASGGPGVDVLVAEAPVLRPGLALTFRDAYVYDAEDRITLVVARASADGYVLAGATEADVVSGAIWGRPWFGPVDRHLSPEWLRLLDFPLVHGKSWEMREGLTVTASAAEVATPLGKEPGFVIEGEDGGFRTRVAYAPSVGFYTEFLTLIDGEPFLHLTLEKVSTSATYVEWEVGAEAETVDGNPATLQVPAGQDAVLVSLGGVAGGRAVATPPPPHSADAWVEEFGAAEEWRARVFPPHPGAWVLGQASPPEGFGYARAVSVTWVHGEVQPE